jgi:hypothetical protein
VQIPSPFGQRPPWNGKTNEVRPLSPFLLLSFTLVLLVSRIAKAASAERFGENKKERRDMLGSFVRHGLTQREMQSEILLQL